MQPRSKAKFVCLAVVAPGALFPSAVAHADVPAERCAADPMTPERARLRLEWARACGTTVNLVSPTSPVAPAFAYQNGLVSANGGIPLWEYIETDDFWGRNSYSGVDASVGNSLDLVTTPTRSAVTRAGSPREIDCTAGR